MQYWDSSALVCLHVRQPGTKAVRDLFENEDQIVTWTLSDIEIQSAIQRLRREGGLSESALREVSGRFGGLWETLNIVSLISPVKVRARRLLGVHNLRAADALQLGAALLSVDDDPTGAAFVCLDARLSEAAHREGFTVLP